MGDLIYSMSTSLDGLICGPGGELDWSVPDEELHRFHNERTRRLGAHLCGRRLYETMLYWESVDEGSLPEHEREFARIWKELPRYVFSSTLEEVAPGWALVRGDVVEEARQMKRDVDGDLGIGGAGLAAACIEHGLVDELEAFVHPVILGRGTPFLPRSDRRTDLELVETQTFAGRVARLRYRRP